jgi:hypothetical protein
MTRTLAGDRYPKRAITLPPPTRQTLNPTAFQISVKVAFDIKNLQAIAILNERSHSLPQLVKLSTRQRFRFR